MAPGDRAIEMMIDAYLEGRIEEKLAAGEDPMDALIAIWGNEEALRSKICYSALDPTLKFRLLTALDEYESRLALATSPVAGHPYRTSPTPIPGVKRSHEGFWAWLGGLFS